MKCRAALSVVFASLIGCASQQTVTVMAVPERSSVVRTLKSTEDARRALVRWFECDECEEGELEDVVSYGEAVVPLLRGAVLEGAAPATQELLRRGLAEQYDKMKQFAEGHPYVKVPSTKEEYVDYYVDNLNAQYKVRAARALAAIGSAAAEAALEEADVRANRVDVKRVISASLLSLK